MARRRQTRRSSTVSRFRRFGRDAAIRCAPPQWKECEGGFAVTTDRSWVALPALLLFALLALPGCSRRSDPGAPASAPLQAVRARALTDVRFESTPERIERGRYLANAAVGCVLCHSERDRNLPGAPPVPGREFAGAILAEEPGYRLVAPNLTPDVATGAGSWSDDMLARAIREGVGHDGRGLGGQMWWWSFRALSDEDLASIIVYLRSLAPVAHALPPRILSAERERERAEGAEPLAGPVAPRDLEDALERGIYLVEIADCMGCHSAWEAPIQPGLGGGGNAVERFGERVFSANLTPDPTGIGPHTEGIFRGALRSGRGGTLHAAMPWAAYRGLTDADIGAIYLALRQLPPVAHRVASVNSGAQPTPCPVCGQVHGFGELNVLPVFARAAVDLGPLADYVGTYRLEVDAMEVTARDGRLYVSDNGRPAVEVVPVDGGRFRGIGLVSPFAFERDAGGKVVAIVTYDLGTTRWERSGTHK